MGEARKRRRQHRRHGRKAENDERQDQHRQHGELHLANLDLLAEELRRAADHQPGDEDCEDREDDHAVEPGADAARQYLAKLDQQQRHKTSQRRQRGVHCIDRAAGKTGGDGGESADMAVPKRTSLPSILPPAGSMPRLESTGVPAVSAQ